MVASRELPSEGVIKVWARLLRAQRVALTGVEADLKTAGVPPLAWYDVLFELKKAGEGGLRPVELEGRLLLEQHNISRLVDRLVVAGHVHRRPCPTDRRGQVLTLTETGRKILRTMWPVYAGAIQRHVGSKIGTDEDVRALSLLLERLMSTRER
ncbi:MAG: winged helix-turn-helix transcriptional regulator [Alphaproteobacteria bacterium]|nr:winged helix-turn-helix transcriptional regulator [Alphaproteobacteria bacterium]